VFAELEVALDRPDERAASRLARLGARQSWPATDRARFTRAAADLRALLADLADHVNGILFYPAATTADLPALAEDVLPRLAADGLARLRGPKQATLMAQQLLEALRARTRAVPAEATGR
jgi:hypothetical protein